MSDAAAAVVGLYNGAARRWAAARGDRPDGGGWLDAFCALLSPGAAVLDLGCGSGRPIARRLAARGFRVTGVDAAPEMIALCRADAPEGDWRVADMRGFAPGSAFAGVLAWDSFFHLTADEQRAMFPVFARCAASGAALMFTSGPAAGVAIGDLFGAPLHHASLDPQDYRALLKAAGFAVVAHVAEDASCCGRTVWLARRL